MAAQVLTVWLEPGHLAGQRAHAAQGGLYLPVPDPAPEPFAEISLCLLASGARAEVAARVVHISPGSGMALAFSDPGAARAALAALFDAAQGAPASARPPRVEWGGPAAEEVSATTEPLPEAPVPEGAAGSPASEEEMDLPADETSLNLWDRIRAMGTNERMNLAKHGDRSARILLMKDTNKAIHTFVIQNPRITLDEVRYIAGYRQTNPEVLKMISENRDWMQNPRVVAALVGNPKTPTAIAVKLLDRLPMNDVRRIAKSDAYPKAVTMAARKKVVGP
jgi:hypothetical protein